jgi:putative transposase
MKRDQALKIATLTRHQFYYIPTGSKSRGRPKSTHTQQVKPEEIVMVPNSVIEKEMLKIERDPDLSCGALRMTQQLQLKGFVINRKKTAAIMAALGITKNNRRKAKAGNRKFVSQRVANPIAPLTMLQMDIKHFWLIAERRAAYVITVIDVFTRETLGHYSGHSIKAMNIKTLWDQIIEEHLEPAGMAESEVQIEIRSDNGPQFISELLREFFIDNGLNQVFTTPYTPEENGHIESFHGIMARSVGNGFLNLSELQNRLDRFYKIYNFERAHTGTKGLPPVIFRRAWEHDLVISCYSERKPTVIKLRYPLYEISGILSQRELLAKKKRAKRDRFNEKGGEISSSAINLKTSVHTSPSVASCNTKENKKIVHTLTNAKLSGN